MSKAAPRSNKCVIARYMRDNNKIKYCISKYNVGSIVDGENTEWVFNEIQMGHTTATTHDNKNNWV